MTDRSSDSTDARTRMPGALLAAALAALFVLAPAAEADWLITTGGERIQTIGPWEVAGNQITYMDVAREQARISAADVDVEKSWKATVESKDVVLYSTSWCGYCRRTRALLNELGVYFLEKDVEISDAAQREFIDLVGPRSGVPVLKIEDDVIRGYNPDAIKGRTARLEQADPRR